MSVKCALLTLVLAAAVCGQQHVLKGRVRTADGAPDAGATVLVRWRAHPELPGLAGWSLGAAGSLGVGSATAHTDPDGRWRLELPVRGPFEVLVVDAQGAPRAPRRFPVLAGAFVDVTLSPPHRVGGLVLDANELPVADVELCLEPHATSWTRYAMHGMPPVRLAARTDAAGRFDRALPMHYLKEPFLEPFLVPLPAAADRCFQRENLLHPTRRAQELRLQLLPIEPRRGRVVDAAGRPVAGARVFDRAAPWREVATDADGAFRFPMRRLQQLAVAAPGFVPGLKPVAQDGRRPDANARIDFELQTAATLRLRLLDAQGASIGARPVLWSTPLGGDPPLEQVAITDPDGGLVFAGCGPDLVTHGFVRLDTGYVPFASCVVPADTDLGDVVVASRSLRGVVVGADGAPEPGARVVVRRPDLAGAGTASEPLWVTYCDHGGRFELSCLPRATLQVLVEAGALGFASRTAPVAEDDVEVRLGGGGAATVEVVDFGGEPVEGVWVLLVHGGGAGAGLAPSPTATSTSVVGFSDAEGRVRFRGLPRGPFRIVANRLVDGRLSSGQAEVHADGEAATVQLRAVDMD